jgi:hypothetical protein
MRGALALSLPALVLTYAGTAQAAATGPTDWGKKCGYTVTSSTLNVRATPSTSASIVDTLQSGTGILAYSGGTVNANGYTWRFVTADAYRWGAGGGWVASNYLQSSGNCEDSPSGTVAANPTLNVRTASGSGNVGTGSVIGTIPNGSTVRIGCTYPGPSVTGPWGSTSVWDAIFGYTDPGGTWHGLSGWAFVADAWINSGGDTSSFVISCF